MTTPTLSALRDLLRRDPSTLGLRFASPVAPAGALAVGVWAVWASLEGGFSPTQWGSFGTGLVLLLGVALVAAPPRAALWERRRVAMIAAMAAFTAWNFLSLIWADFPGDAWAGADKTLLYAASFTLFAAWPWTPRALVAVLGLFALAVVVVGAVVLARATLAADASTFFLEGRLLQPTGYPNGNVALWMSALWPALYLASSPAIAPSLRALALAGAGFLLDLAVLGQSRAWLFLMPVVLVLALLLARHRLRFVLASLLAAASTATVAGPLLAVHDRAVAGVPPGALLDRAAQLVTAACAVLAVAGAVWALVDRRVQVGRRGRLAATAALLVALVAGLAAAGVVATREIDHPRDWIAARWDDFTTGSPLEVRGSRFTGSLGTNRYEEWRVAWLEFVDHPVLGIGSDNYAAAYLLRRKDDAREPRYPHSIELRLLSQLGIVGTLLFAVSASLAVWLALARRRQLDQVAGGAVGAALMVFAYWLVYGSADWFWEIPALAGPAFGLLGLAGAVTASRQDVPPAKSPKTRGRLARQLAARAALGASVAAASASLVLPGLASAYTDAGVQVWGREPAAAFERLERAADLNPLSAEPLLLEGSIALRLEDEVRARDALTRALEREPKNWYANVQLALLAGSLGDYAEAERYIGRALELNPRDKVAARVARLIERRKPIDPDLLNDRYLRQFVRRFPGSLRSSGIELS